MEIPLSSPKSLVYQLHRHWDVVEALCRLSRELLGFNVDQVLAAVRRAEPGEDDPAVVLRTLVNADLLQPLGRSDDWQLNPLVTEFVRGLTREHELGLTAVLKARIDALRDATAQVDEGVHTDDMDRLTTGATQLSELFRQIQQQLDQDRHAILDIAERAKSADTALTPARRYRTVLEAYDKHVDPINAMMNTGPGGTFYPLLEQATAALDHAQEHLAVQGALYTQRLRLRHVAQQAKELRRLGRTVAQQCSDTLLPLRDEARRHNQLSAAISRLLGQVRKRGLRRALRTPAGSALPVWARQRRGRVHLGDEVRQIMAVARAWQPRHQAFPEPPSVTADRVPRIDEARLAAELRTALPVDNLMVWLRGRYSHLPDAALLRLYHDLVRETHWQAQLATEETATELHQVRVRYHPHRLQPLSPP